MSRKLLEDFEILTTFVGAGYCEDCGKYWHDDLMVYHQINMILCDSCAKLHTDLKYINHDSVEKEGE